MKIRYCLFCGKRVDNHIGEVPDSITVTGVICVSCLDDDQIKQELKDWVKDIQDFANEKKNEVH